MLLVHSACALAPSSHCDSGLKGDLQHMACAEFCSVASHCKFCKCALCEICKSPEAQLVDNVVDAITTSNACRNQVLVEPNSWSRRLKHSLLRDTRRLRIALYGDSIAAGVGDVELQTVGAKPRRTKPCKDESERLCRSGALQPASATYDFACAILGRLCRAACNACAIAGSSQSMCDATGSINAKGFGPRVANHLSWEFCIRNSSTHVHFHNRAVPAQGPMYHLLCGGISDETSSIIVVEFIRRGADAEYEALIRRLLGLPHKPSVILLSWVSMSELRQAAQTSDSRIEKQLADHYSLPLVDVRNGLLHTRKTGCVDAVQKLSRPRNSSEPETNHTFEAMTGVDVLRADPTHPSSAGHEVIARMLLGVLQEAVITRLEMDEPDDPPLPPALVPGAQSLAAKEATCLSMLRKQQEQQLAPVERRGFALVVRGAAGFEKRCWEGRELGDTISFHVATNASRIYVLGFASVTGGSARVHIDGIARERPLKLHVEATRWPWLEPGRGLPIFIELASDLSAGSHVISFTVIASEGNTNRDVSPSSNNATSVQIIALATM